MNKTLKITNVCFLGAGIKPSIIEFKKNLNVICGASDTGKSFLIEVIDFLLGGSDLRDIPELHGYEKARITINSSEKGIWTFERSIAGGNYKIFQGDIQVSTNVQPNGMLKMKHAAGREDNISGWLLGALGLLSQNIRKNAQGDCRSLSFRDIARLVIVDEREIIRQNSPYLTGQYISKTAEKSTLKLLLTGLDDSSIVPFEVSSQEENDIFDGVVDSYEASHKCEMSRLRVIMAQAAAITIDANPLSSVTRPRDKQGICHQLVNDSRLNWSESDE